MKTHLILPIICSILIGCGFSKIFNNPKSINTVNSIEIEKNPICINEDVKITINTNKNDSEGMLYIIGEKKGNPVVLSFPTPGKKTVNITINDIFNSNIENKHVEIDVENCLPENKLSITANPDKFNMGILNFTTDAALDKIKDYKWNFGDGKSEITTTPFVQHDYRTRKQKALFSSYIVKITGIGLDGKEYSGKTSISIPNINYLSKKMGNPNIPIKYNRFPKIQNDNFIIDITFNNIFEEIFFIDEVAMKFKNHLTETPLKELIYNSNEILKSTEISGNQVSSSQIAIPLSTVPENTTRIFINLQGTLNQKQNAYSKIYLDLPPKNNDLANSQKFEEVKNQVLIRKLEQAEKIYGKGRPITVEELKMLEVSNEK